MNKDLIDLIQIFRKGIENLDEKDFYYSTNLMRTFPNHCCDDASQLLAAYMSDNGFNNAELIRGEWGGNHNEIRSHVWLYYNHTNIDITASQFNIIGYDHPPVLISSNNLFHSSFKVVNDGIADFRIHLKKYSDYSLESQFQYTYDMILKQLAINSL